MDEITKQAKSFLNQRVQEVRNQHENLSKAEKKAEMEKLDRILFSLGDEDREWLDKHMTDDVILANDLCEALYLAGLKDGLRFLKMISI